MVRLKHCVVLADDATSTFAAAIHDHLELKRRNSALEFDMPLANYLPSHASRAVRPVEDDPALEDEDTLPRVMWPASGTEPTFPGA
jgi:hypothetical protein